MKTSLLRVGFEPTRRGFSVRGLCRIGLPQRVIYTARRIRTCNLRNLSPAPLAIWATAAVDARTKGARGNRTLATTFTVSDAATTTRAPSRKSALFHSVLQVVSPGPDGPIARNKKP